MTKIDLSNGPDSVSFFMQSGKIRNSRVRGVEDVCVVMTAIGYGDEVAKKLSAFRSSGELLTMKPSIPPFDAYKNLRIDRLVVTPHEGRDSMVIEIELRSFAYIPEVPSQWPSDSIQASAA